MKLSALALLLSAASALAATWDRSPQAIRKLYAKTRADSLHTHHERAVKPIHHISTTAPRRRSPFYNSKTKKFWVNGRRIPDVKFNVSESYAGLLPISSDANESRKLYFWFFPSTGSKETTDDLVIWLNGGPGCSSLEGFLQENGPFTWKYGTYLPVENEYSWVKLANMVWIEQPVGTGFSQGVPNINSQEEMADQFLGFLKNFVQTFGLQGKRIWLTGESYAGKYIPYIADAMYERKDTQNFNLKGSMLYDPAIDSDLLLEEVPAVPYVLRNNAIFNLPDDVVANLTEAADNCGYTALYNAGRQYPPVGALQDPPKACGRSLWNDIYTEAMKINPCFNIYHITDTCPLLWDVLGFPGSFDYLPKGAKVYFARPEVQRAINAPIIESNWTECSIIDVFPGPEGDRSPYPVPAGVLSRVIEKSERTVIAHGLLDYVLLAEGTLLSIQNMTWGGAQGFLNAPTKKFAIPAEGQTDMGLWHEERGLTYIEIKLAGHMVPQYQPAAGYRHLEYLLGRVKDLSS